MTLWWLSFADDEKPEGTQFLGVVIAEEDDFIGAVQECHARSCNPGGQVVGWEIANQKEVEGWPRWTLLSRKELEDKGALVKSLNEWEAEGTLLQ